MEHFNPHEREARDGRAARPRVLRLYILIHTSVKLVTNHKQQYRFSWGDFNPHEREARDQPISQRWGHHDDFNPHEREARDITFDIIGPSYQDFNPHEREARDEIHLQA